jgi:hypothetical protein
MTNEPRPCRNIAPPRRFRSRVLPRFSLRSVFLSIFLSCVAFAWLGLKVREGRRQALAVGQVSSLGAAVTYEPELMFMPVWIEAILGRDMFRSVERVTCAEGTDVTSVLSWTRAFPSLTQLDLTAAHINDEDLKVIGGMRQLNFLSLYDASNVTDQGIAHLAGSPSLETLWLSGTQVSDTGIGHVARCHSLTNLGLADTSISDDALADVARLDHLVVLNLAWTLVTDAGMREIARLPSVGALLLGATKVGDEGAKHLSTIRTLEHLSMSGTKISDIGAGHHPFQAVISGGAVPTGGRC